MLGSILNIQTLYSCKIDWALQVKRRSLGLMSSNFMCWTISLAQNHGLRTRLERFNYLFPLSSPPFLIFFLCVYCCCCLFLFLGFPPSDYPCGGNGYHILCIPTERSMWKKLRSATNGNLCQLQSCSYNEAHRCLESAFGLVAIYQRPGAKTIQLSCSETLTS